MTSCLDYQGDQGLQGEKGSKGRVGDQVIN